MANLTGPGCTLSPSYATITYTAFGFTYTTPVFPISTLDGEIATVTNIGTIKSIQIIPDTGSGSLNCCPDGYSYDPTAGACVPVVQNPPPPPPPASPSGSPTCPNGYTYDTQTELCIWGGSGPVGAPQPPPQRPIWVITPPPPPPVVIPPGDGDAATDCCEATNVALGTLITAVNTLPGPVDYSACCAGITAALQAIQASVAAIQTALTTSGAPPPQTDLTPIEATLTAIASALAPLATSDADLKSIATAISGMSGATGAPGPDYTAVLEDIDKQLTSMVQMMTTDRVVDPSVGQALDNGALTTFEIDPIVLQ